MREYAKHSEADSCTVYQHRQLFLNGIFFSADGQSPGDFLTCGGCKQKFVLSDLTKFVQHKVLECTKEKKANCDSEEENEEEKEQNVRHKSLGSPSVSGSGQVDDDECSRIKSEGEEKKPSVRDNGANTVKSGMLSGSQRLVGQHLRGFHANSFNVSAPSFCVF